MKSHKTHAKQILASLYGPLSLFEGLTPILVGWRDIFGAWAAAVGTEDGFVPYVVLRDFDQCGHKITDDEIDALVAAGKWKRVKHGIEVVDWEVTQAPDHIEEQYHEDLDEPPYKKVDAEAVRADVTASIEEDVVEVDTDPENASEGHTEAVEALPEDDDSEDVTDDDIEDDEEAKWNRYDDSDDDDDEEEIRPLSEILDLPKRPVAKGDNSASLSALRDAISNDTEHELKSVDELDDEVIAEVTVKESTRTTVKANFEYTAKEEKEFYDEFLEIFDKQPVDHKVCWEWFKDDLADFGEEVVLDAADEYRSRTGGDARRGERYDARQTPDEWLEASGVSKYKKRLDRSTKTK